MFTSARKTWTWQSIRPGIRVRLPQSTTCALAALIGLDRHFLDSVALDQHLVAAARLVPARVEQIEIPEKDLRHQCSPNMRGGTLRWPPIWRYSRAKVRGMRRVVVIGTTGSGKSTLAERLAAQTGPARGRARRAVLGPRLAAARRSSCSAIGSSARPATTAGSWSATTARCATSSGGRRHAGLARPAVVAGDVAAGAAHAAPRRSPGRTWGTGNRETWRNSFFSRQSILLWALKTHRRNRRRFTLECEFLAKEKRVVRLQEPARG